MQSQVSISNTSILQCLIVPGTWIRFQAQTIGPHGKGNPENMLIKY